MFETNTFGVIAMARAIVPHMRERGSGAIVNVTSSVVFNPAPMVSVYTATKTAVEGFSEALYYELAPLGIRVKLVEPGYGRDTKFESNMMALNDENSFPALYQPQLSALMRNLPEVSTNLEDVAAAVLQAVNDTSPTLRFPAGADSIAIAKKHAELSEDAFLTSMREAFGVQQQLPDQCSASLEASLPGRALGLPKSAAGKAVIRLEDRLGTRLLNRTTRTLSLTDEGRVFYDRGLQVRVD